MSPDQSISRYGSSDIEQRRAREIGPSGVRLLIDRNNRRLQFEFEKNNHEVIFDQPAMYDTVLFLAEHQGEEISFGQVNKYLMEKGYSLQEGRVSCERVGDTLTAPIRSKIDPGYWRNKPTVFLHDARSYYFALNAEVEFIEELVMDKQEAAILAKRLLLRDKHLIQLPSTQFQEYTLDQEMRERLMRIVEAFKTDPDKKQPLGLPNDTIGIINEELKARVLKKVEAFLAADPVKSKMILQSTEPELQEVLQELARQNRNEVKNNVIALLDAEARTIDKRDHRDFVHAVSTIYVLQAQLVVAPQKPKRVNLGPRS